MFYKSPAKKRLRDLEEQVADLRKVLMDSSKKETRSDLFIASVKEAIMLLKWDDLISTALRETGCWDQHIIAAVDRIPPYRRRLAVDVGAHFGAITLRLQKRFSEVVSFEPNDFSFGILKANMALNRVDNVTLFNHGVFSSSTNLSLGKAEQQEIPLPVDSSGGFDPLLTPNIASYAFTPDGSGEYLRPARTLDDFKLHQADFIKIDVQGADGEVIIGAIETIRRCRPIIIFEWEEILSENFGVRFDELAVLFKNESYKLETLYRHNDKQVDFMALPQELHLSP